MHLASCRICTLTLDWQGLNVVCLLQIKQPQHAKKPSIGAERGSDLERPSTDDLAREVYNYTGETGTYRYMAPEVFRHEPYNAKVRRAH